MLKGVEICKLMKIPVLSVWPGSDGADYHFQIDYKQSIEWFTEALVTVNKECLKHGIKLAIEPKPYEPRELYMIIPTAASAILVAQQVNQACGGNNCGLTIDYGHQKMEATTASTSCDLAAYAGVPVHKFDINDARQGRNDQDLMFGTVSIPESVEYLYTTFVRDYRGYYSQDQFTYREDPTRAIERSMINFANLALKAVRIYADQPRLDRGARGRHRPGRARRRLAGAGRLSRQVDSAFATAIGDRLRHANFACQRCASVDFGRIVRAIVVSADGDHRHRRPRLSQRRSRRADASVAIRIWRGRIRPTTSARSGSRSRPRLADAAATPGFHATQVIGIGVDTTGLHAAADRREGASAGARSAIRKQPRRARVAVEGPHRRGGSRGDHRDRQGARAAISRADRRHLFVRVVVVEDLEDA